MKLENRLKQIQNIQQEKERVLKSINDDLLRKRLEDIFNQFQKEIKELINKNKEKDQRIQDIKQSTIKLVNYVISNQDIINEAKRSDVGEQDL